MPPSPPAPRRHWLARVWAWRRDATLGRLYVNAGKLFTGQASGAVLGLAAIWFTTASLGLTLFGVLVAIQSFTKLVGNTLKFSTWEAVVKYGADDLARDDRDAFRRLVAFNTLLDIGTALAAFAVCVGIAWFVLPLINVSRGHFWFAAFMCLGAFFTVSATPVGVLRLFDRFGLLALAEPVGPLVRLCLCALFYYTGSHNLWVFGAAFLASSTLDRGITVCLGWRELRRRGLAPRWQDLRRPTSNGHPGLWKFALANNARISLGVLTKESDDLIVAAFVGPAGVALWKIAKQVSSALSTPARLFVFSVFPQLARLWSARDYRAFRRLVVRSSITSTAGALMIVVLFAVFGTFLLQLFFFKATQHGFVAAFEPGLLLLSSRVVTMLMSPFLPALTAMGHVVRNLKLALVLAAVTVPTMLLLTWQFGLTGAGISRILAEVLTASVFGWTVMHAINSRIRKSALAPPPEPPASSAPAPAGV
jgi:O-antigen/teichoic acid export membrane protein